jgi:hypothetical protein
MAVRLIGLQGMGRRSSRQQLLAQELDDGSFLAAGALQGE